MKRLKNRSIILLSLIVSTFFFAAPTFAGFSFSDCFDSVKHIISPDTELPFNPVELKLDQLVILESIGKGIEAEVFKVKYQDQEYAFRLPNILKLNQDPFYRLLRQEEKEKLAQIDLPQANEIISTMSKKQILNKSEMRLYMIADTIINFDYITKMDKLHYQGRRIAPKMIALIKNKDDVIIGQLMELIPGNTLEKLIKQKTLTKKMVEQISKKIEDQVKILQHHHFAHGDLGFQNMLVDFPLDSDQINVRFIDFNLYRKVNTMKQRLDKDMYNLYFILKELKRDIPSAWKVD